jgi:hypothetical protein
MPLSAGSRLGPYEIVSAVGAGGTHPRWRRDGKELFYVSNDSRMMAADVTPTSDAVRVDGTRALFSIHAPFQPGYVYDVTPGK